MRVRMSSTLPLPYHLRNQRRKAARTGKARAVCHARPRRGPSDALLPGGDLPNRDPVDFAASLIQEYASLKQLLRCASPSAMAAMSGASSAAGSGTASATAQLRSLWARNWRSRRKMCCGAAPDSAGKARQWPLSWRSRANPRRDAGEQARRGDRRSAMGHYRSPCFLNRCGSLDQNV
jgi:hypothetical protein